MTDGASTAPFHCSCLNGPSGYISNGSGGTQSVHDACYNCLNWAHPNNKDGSFCTKCAALADNPAGNVWGNTGSVDNAYNCFSCTVGLGGICSTPQVWQKV